MAYHAHSIEGRPKEEWQLLKDHLKMVSELSSNFASAFGESELGEIVGLLHDIGKYSKEFQRRLDDPRVRVDHSSAGARLAMAKYDPSFGRIIAYAIAGHHGGLQDGGTGEIEGTLAYRLKHKDLADYSRYKSEIEPPEKQSKLGIVPQQERLGFSVSFLIRMLYSCLVDADFLDTERFYDARKSAVRAEKPNIETLAISLQAHLSELTRKAPKTKVNETRAQVLEDCLKAAKNEKGLYTLTVPTGGGKTLSSLAFALEHAMRHGLERVIYVIPFTSIIEQNADVFRDAVGLEGVLEHHSNVIRDGSDYAPEINKKLELAEENWDMPLVVTTNVQFYESLFSNKVSRCRKLHNIAQSVIILDEAQTLPVELLKPCIAALVELVTNYGSTVVLCSATQPALEGLIPRNIRSREITSDPETLYKELKRVRVNNCGKISNQELAEAIIELDQVLCIVNIRAHARSIFELIGEVEGHYHLSAAMCPVHRSQKLAEIRARLERGLPCRVISTQLIEAGVDIDFPVVYRSIAGVDSIAQAAGRCNREGKQRQGQVFVFIPKEGEGLDHIWFKRTSSITAPLLDEEDLLSLEVVNKYFRELYFYESARLDEYRILDKLEEGRRSLNFPFQEVADLFRIINEDTYSIVIPFNDNADRLLAQAEFVLPRDVLRGLQRYVVSVRPWECKKLMDGGALKKVGNLLVLQDMSLYDLNYGLSINGIGDDNFWII